MLHRLKCENTNTIFKEGNENQIPAWFCFQRSQIKYKTRTLIQRGYQQIKQRESGKESERILKY